MERSRFDTVAHSHAHERPPCSMAVSNRSRLYLQQIRRSSQDTVACTVQKHAATEHKSSILKGHALSIQVQRDSVRTHGHKQERYTHRFWRSYEQNLQLKLHIFVRNILRAPYRLLHRSIDSLAQAARCYQREQSRQHTGPASGSKASTKRI